MKTDGEAIASLNTQIINVQTDITEIKSDIKMMLSQLGAANVQNSLFNKELDGIKLEIVDLKRKEGFWSWMKPTLAAGAGAIMTILISSYLQHLGK